MPKKVVRDWPMCKDCEHFTPSKLDWGRCFWKDKLRTPRATAVSVFAYGEMCISHQVDCGIFGRGE